MRHAGDGRPLTNVVLTGVWDATRLWEGPVMRPGGEEKVDVSEKVLLNESLPHSCGILAVTVILLI